MRDLERQKKVIDKRASWDYYNEGTQINYMSKKKTSHEVDIKFSYEIPHHFLVLFKKEYYAAHFKGFLDNVLKLNDEQNGLAKVTMYSYYMLSPYDDFLYYFHIANGDVFPDNIKFFTENSFFANEFIEIEQREIMRRGNNDKIQEFIRKW